MIIEKIASQEGSFKRNMYFFERARDGFKALLQQTISNPQETVLLPAYIGWSPREGSGVFDPIRETGVRFSFYKLDDELHIDLLDLKKQLEKSRIKVFVLIHYFGHVDPNYKEIITMVRSYGCVILEDEAHALFTDQVDGKVGRDGDAVIYSLHKMLPVKKGGALICNQLMNEHKYNKSQVGNILSQYDLYAIATRRKINVSCLNDLILDVKGVRPLWRKIEKDETLQTFPIVVEQVNRDQLYEEMNKAGLGVVSLYHTLIPNLDREMFSESYCLSQKIMNLPVHQDVDETQLRFLVATLRRIVEKLK